MLILITWQWCHSSIFIDFYSKYLSLKDGRTIEILQTFIMSYVTIMLMFSRMLQSRCFQDKNIRMMLYLLLDKRWDAFPVNDQLRIVKCAPYKIVVQLISYQSPLLGIMQIQELFVRDGRPDHWWCFLFGITRLKSHNIAPMRRYQTRWLVADRTKVSILFWYQRILD